MAADGRHGPDGTLPGLRRRYAQIFTVVAVVLAGASLVSHRYVAAQARLAAEAAAHHEHSERVLDEAFAAFYRVRRGLDDFLLAPSQPRRTRLEQAVQRLDRATTRLDALIDTQRADVGPLPEAGLPAIADRDLRWRKAFERLLTARGSDGLPPEPGNNLREPLDPLLQGMQQRLERLREALQAQRRRQAGTLVAISRTVDLVLLAALGLVLVSGVVGYLGLDRLILRPIRALADSLKAGSAGPGVPEPAPPAFSETRDLLDAFARLRDRVTERDRALDHLVHHDTLTGLPNRTLFRRRLADAIGHAQSQGLLVGLLFMDLDRFKQINDSYGHAAGDRMLVEIGRRLLSVFRQDDLVARLGGDEFAVLLENIHARDEMMLLADKALDAIERPYSFDDHVFYSGASIGIAVAPDDGLDPDRLIQLADAAMYASKHDEGSSYRFVSSDLSAHAAARHTLENELRSAIRQQQLALHFQPVVSASDGTLHCYEALLRWPHAEQGMLRPASFMDALADAGLCESMSDWALDEIDTQRPDRNAVVSINLSARLLHDAAFAQRLFDRIESGRIDPRRMILEITEDTLEADLQQAIPVLTRLARLGVRIALDDFGTGKASLSHLRRFAFDYIKIDRSFVSGIGSRPADEKLIEAIIGLAHALDMRVVAEGVEQPAQRAFLADHGCDYVQGYLVGRPAASIQT